MKNFIMNLWGKIIGKAEKSAKPSYSPKQHKPKFAIIVGHSVSAKGASTYKRGVYEYDFNYEVAYLIKSSLCSMGYECEVFLRNGTNMDGVADNVEDYGANVTVELHLNSFSKVALGCEVLAELSDKDSIELGDWISDEIQRVYGIKQRDGNGVKEVKYKDRGEYNLRVFENSRFTSILVEPCFANFRTSESEKIIESPKKYASMLAVALHKYYSV